MKIEHQRPGGMLQPLETLEWKWESISMNFIVVLPHRLDGHNSIWVIADKLTKFTKWRPRLFIAEIVRFHSVPTIVVSDQDQKLTSRFLKAFDHAMRAKLSLDKSNYPQSNG